MKFALLTSARPELVKVWVCQETSPGGSLLPPVDLASIAATGRQAGLDMRLLDLRLERDPLLFLRQWLSEEKPWAIILNLTTVSAAHDYELLRFIPSDVKKFAFGTHAQSNVQEAFDRGFDGVFLGDPEAVLLALQANGFDPELTPGLLTRAQPGKSAHTVENLDELPFPALDLLPMEKYSAPYIQRGNRFTILMSSRGCPFQCTYCLYPTLFGGKARSRSVKNVVDEMEHDFRIYGVREFYFLDATFNLDRNRIVHLCEELIRRGLKLRWSCNMRVAPIDAEMLALMKSAGCRWIFFGVEDQDLLRETKKGTTPSATQRAFALAKTAGIQTMAFTMVFPRDDLTEEEYVARVTGNLEKLDAVAFQCNVAIPFPGTAMFDEFRQKYPRLKLDWALYDPHGDKVPYDSKLDLHRVKKLIYRRFLFRHPMKVARVALQMEPVALMRQASTFISKTLLG